MSLPSVVIIGAGNIAYHLVLNFISKDISVRQVYNRSLKRLRTFSKFSNVAKITNLEKLDTTAEIYILAVADDAIPVMANKLSAILKEKNCIVAHTSGNCTIDVLSFCSKNYGSFYPLQSIRKERTVDFKKIPIFISYSTSKSYRELEKLGLQISDNVIKIGDKDRSRLHIPAVIVNNFVNHLFSLAYDYCQSEGLDFEHLIPLIEETVDRVAKGGIPSKLQTGPSMRGDHKTLKNHRKLLEEHKATLRVYNYMTKHIIKYYEDHQGV